MFLPIYDVQNSGMVHAVLTWTGNLLCHTECIRDTEFDLFLTRQRVQVEIVCGRDKTQLAVFSFLPIRFGTGGRLQRSCGYIEGKDDGKHTQYAFLGFSDKNKSSLHHKYM